MLFCMNCGNQITEGTAFCTSCGNAVMRGSTNQAEYLQGMNEEFAPLFGVGGKRAVFTTNSLIYGDDEYTYAQLSPICLLSAPTSLSNGVAQVTINGKISNLSYALNQKDRFIAAMTYANEQIDIAHGNTKNYKFILQANTGAKLEVYEDYLMFYDMSSSAVGIVGKASDKVSGIGGGLGKGFGKLIGTVGSYGTAVGNVMKGGSTGKIIMFADLSAFQLNADSLTINKYSMPISQENMTKAKEIVAHVRENKTIEKADTQEQLELWEPIKGTVRTFPFNGIQFEVSESMDIFNTYRLKFRELAMTYAGKAEKEYNTRIHDFVTYIEFFPKIYISNLEPLIQKAVDILISEEVWTVTFDSFKNQHLSDFHLALSDYDVTIESANITITENQQRTAGVMSMIPGMQGGGFGLKGALKGMATAAAYNTVRDGIENSAIKNASNVHPMQQQELYGRINPKILLDHVFVDYWRVFLSLVHTLKQTGLDIWYPADELYQQTGNVFKNLSNPNFPQDKVSNVFLQILEIMPYDAEYYKFVISRFGETEEIIAIKNYFGFTDLDNSRLC